MSGFLDDFNADIDPGLMDELGDDVTFIPKGQPGVPIKGGFIKAYYEAANGFNAGVDSSSPAIECLDRDVVNACEGKIIRNGVSYDIVGIQPDGTGITLLILRHAK